MAFIKEDGQPGFSAPALAVDDFGAFDAFGGVAGVDDQL
jgi:hypothetical protein